MFCASAGAAAEPIAGILRRVVLAWLKRNSREQLHDTRGWRFLWVNAVLMALVAIVSIFLRLNVLAPIMVCSSVGAAFIAGYSYRQRVLDVGTKPKWGLLVLKNDALLRTTDAPLTTSDEPVDPAPRRTLRRRLVIAYSIAAVVGLVRGVVLESAIVAVAIVGFALVNVVVISMLLSDRVNA
jgi:hypothetical protein